jgi:phosphatidylserine/phosphatidylglycerophosphate/cardiolipin synthase-like enzyme
MDPRGIGLLFQPLMNALGRGVHVTIVTHGALDATSINATAVEELRREAERARGKLDVYSADSGSGLGRRDNPLLHAKVIVADGTKVLLGSANLTSYALSTNLEAGTVLGRTSAQEVTTVVAALIRTGAVYLTFSIHG